MIELVTEIGEVIHYLIFIFCAILTLPIEIIENPRTD